MRGKYPVLAVAATLLLSSCLKEEEALPADETPEFELSGSIAGNQRTFSAGKEGFFLDAGFENRSDALKAYTAEFSNPNCTDCPEKLILEFFEPKPKNLDVEAFLTPGSLSLLGKEEMGYSYTAALEAKVQGEGPFEYEWTVEEKVVSDKERHVMKLPAPREVPVSLKVSKEGQSRSIDRLFRPRFMRRAWATITYRQRGDQFTLSPIVRGDRNYQYQATWIIAAALRPLRIQQEQPTITLSPGFHKVRLLLESRSYNTYAETWILYNPDGEQRGFVPSVSVDIDSTLVPEPLLGKVRVSYTDKDGNSFSNTNKQPAWAAFQVLSAESYKNNRSGLPTRKMEIDFSVLLEGETGEVSIRNLKGSIAVAYPE